jgi:hypothetical protein
MWKRGGERPDRLGRRVPRARRVPVDAVGHGSARTTESKGDKPPLFGRLDDDGGRRLRQLQEGAAAEKELDPICVAPEAEKVSRIRPDESGIATSANADPVVRLLAVRRHGETMKTILAALLLCAAFAAHAGNAILELDCRYPQPDSAGPGTAAGSLSFGNHTEAVSVIYVVSSAALKKELSARSGVTYTKVTEDHYVSTGRTYTVRNIEKWHGLIDNTCAEAISVLVAKLRQSEPEEVLGLPSVELYLLDSFEKLGWSFTAKQVRDQSTTSHLRTTETYYFHKQE